MNVIIIEDARLARLELVNLLSEHPHITIIAQTGDPDEGIELVKKHQPELLFLDIQMPGKNGFEVLDAVDFTGQVIFTTAYDEYAIRSFDYDAFDYLLKPIEPERLAITISKLNKSQPNQASEPPSLDIHSSVFIKDGDHCDFVAIKDIFMLESCGHYCHVYYQQHKPVLKKSLNHLLTRLPSSLFFRANRQQIINLKHIINVDFAVNGNLLLTLSSGQEVEASRRYSSQFKQLMSL